MADEGRQDTQFKSQRRPSSTERPQPTDTLSGTKHARRLRGFMAAAQAADSDEDPGSSEIGTADADLLENTARLQVEAFRAAKRMPVNGEHNGQKNTLPPPSHGGGRRRQRSLRSPNQPAACSPSQQHGVTPSVCFQAQGTW